MLQAIVNALVLGFAAHMVGDYLIQSDWMAQEKLEHLWVALVHAFSYGIPFIPLLPLLGVRWPLGAWLAITLTHAVIDRYRLARHVTWFKNQFAPWVFRPPHTATGHAPDRPVWLTTWLLILVDNMLHIFINTVTLVWL